MPICEKKLILGHFWLSMVSFWVVACCWIFVCSLYSKHRLDISNNKSLFQMVCLLHVCKVGRKLTPEKMAKSKITKIDVTSSIFVRQQPFTYICNQHQKIYLNIANLLKYFNFLKIHWNTYYKLFLQKRKVFLRQHATIQLSVLTWSLWPTYVLVYDH